MSNERWQQEAEEERMAHNLDALKRIMKAGLPDVAKELAAELGLSKEFQRVNERRVVNG